MGSAGEQVVCALRAVLVLLAYPFAAFASEAKLAELLKNMHSGRSSLGFQTGAVQFPGGTVFNSLNSFVRILQDLGSICLSVYVWLLLSPWKWRALLFERVDKWERRKSFQSCKNS